MSWIWLKEHADGWFCDDCNRWETCYTCSVTKNLVSKIISRLFWKAEDEEVDEYIDDIDYYEESEKRQKILYDRK
jgi:hypothetical protein